jgi:hypothetical protein
MASNTKVPLKKNIFMMFFYICLFINWVGVNIKNDILGSKTFSLLIESIGTPFHVNHKLDKYDISFNALEPFWIQYFEAK